MGVRVARFSVSGGKANNAVHTCPAHLLTTPKQTPQAVPRRGDDPEHDAREKALSRIATRCAGLGRGGGGGAAARRRKRGVPTPTPPRPLLRPLSGVVQLFNAVAKAQRDARTAEAAGAKTAGAAAAGRAAFLAALRGSAPDAAPTALPPGARAYQSTGGAGAAPGGGTGWDVLRGDVDAKAGGAKLKEWDARAAGASAGPVGDALAGSSSEDGSDGGAGGW